ncbi:Alpha/Beta hydrolase protein [Aspergillus coremiiformis]|uniref:Alpha/Beta hydrolase protein n=1 Tax=Aspergillus coremiiformis TaxID=138285 RepID=A0A5N6YTC6_9EURO|nr:Alpha/Beta hydrolase protein [Aspergillus coremiiformis]
MTDPPKRVVLEKSRTVRRRYQRSNKRLKFTASQIARIEREEERERRAQKLREKEKKRIANKKKKAEKEAKAREERRRLGVSDPSAPTVPSSQPSLFNFLKKGPQALAEQQTTFEDTEPDTISTEADTCEESGSENDELSDAEAVGLATSVGNVDGSTESNEVKSGENDEDEFSDCSIFYDEDVIREAETAATAQCTVRAPQDRPAPISLPAEESFRDDTALLLEEFAWEFDTDEEFEQELARIRSDPIHFGCPSSGLSLAREQRQRTISRQTKQKMPFLTINNHQLHYADSHPNGAPANGQTIIFIHGLGSSQNYYFPILPYLTPHHRCITLDTYGSARSPYTGHQISIASITADTIGVLDALSIPQAIAIGHSMGGLVATNLGIDHAPRIKAIVAVGPTHPSPTLTTTMTTRKQTVTKAGMEPLANSIPHQATGSGCSALAKSFIRELLIAQDPVGYGALCEALAAAPRLDYAAVRAPFLLLAGEEDRSASLEGCRVVFEGVASARKSMVVLDRVGHWHCLEAPEVVGEVVGRFVGGL